MELNTMMIVICIIVIAIVSNETYAKLGLPAVNYDSNLLSIDAVTLPATSMEQQRLGEQHCQKACLEKYYPFTKDTITTTDINSLDAIDAATKCLLAPVCSKCWESCKITMSSTSTIIPLKSTATASQMTVVVDKPTKTKNKSTSILLHHHRLNYNSNNNNNNNQMNPWPLRIATMVKQEFLVLTHLAWEQSDILTNCLVTWEVYGGGLMGNLLTDSSNVELSLWPETKYRVQVTCKNKVTGKAIKSPPLLVDTSDAIAMKPDTPPSEKISATAFPPPPPPPPPSTSPSFANDNDILLLHNDDDIINQHTSNIIDTSSSSYQKDTISILSKENKNILYLKNIQSIWLFNLYENMGEIILGICTALIVFLFILTMFCVYRGKRFNYLAKDVALLENDEISVHCES